MPNDNLKHHLHLHFIVLIWGFTAVLGALISLEAIPLVWFRMSLAALVVLCYMWIRGIRFAVKVKFLWQMLGLGLALALHWLTFFGAIKISNVSVTLSVMATGAFFAALLEPLIFSRPINWRELLLGLIAVVGLGIIFQASTEYMWGIVMALISAFLSALFSVFNGRLVQSHSASSISFFELFFGVLGISIYLLFNGDFDASFFVLSFSDWTYLLILSSICTAYAFIASVNLMKWLSPFTLMLTINLEPVYGILLALLVFGDSEYMSGMFYLGAGIILATVLANAYFKAKASRNNPK
jgi:drug/metabolite transporter (DMT)-like permease